MRIICQQMILMKYHALFVIFEKAAKLKNYHLLQIIGGILWVKPEFVATDTVNVLKLWACSWLERLFLMVPRGCL